ncbi:conserved hypothetical protein [Shigella dysenteriae 1617]|nr:conserved hypothetical protein [Shigella dysenteriae 1617]
MLKKRTNGSVRYCQYTSYRRQREMKEELSGLDDLASIRAFDVE